jgi:hypothetical protein
MGSNFSQSGQFDDVDNSSYVAGSATITTSASELKVGASRLTARQTLMVQNTGSNTIYIGPSGVTTLTGIPLMKNQFISMPVGDSIAVFAITASSTSTVVIQEVG